MVAVTEFIPVNEPLLSGNEKKYLAECIDSGWISSEGPFVAKFEDAVARLTRRQYAIAVTNGTAAIDVAIEALGIGPGDEVILPAFTIISCIMQIVRVGATPVLVDSDWTTWNMDINKIEAKITPRTKAILAVHIYGLPVDLDPIIEMCRKYDLYLIEDAAEMIGQEYKGKPCGSFGDISTLSFYPNKHITTGEGGMILTNNKELAEVSAHLRNLCFGQDERFKHQRLGWNLRMTNLQAAVGLAQIERLDEFVQLKRSIGRQYHERLKNIEAIDIPLPETSYAHNIYWVFGLTIKKEAPYNVAAARQYLTQVKIGSRPFFCPMNQQPALHKIGLFKNEYYPIADDLYKHGLYIPSGLSLKPEQIDRVCDELEKFFV